MIEEKELSAVGRFQRTHALKGELNALIDIDPDFFEDGRNPMIVEMDGCFVPFYLESIRTKGATSFLIKIDGIESEEQARQFVNKTIYAERAVLKEYFAEEDENLIDGDDWNGYEIVDSELGPIGKIERIDDSTVNILLVVETEEGEQLFIPLAEEFIENIDNDRRKITMRLPEGLIDLNRKKDE